MVRQYYDQDGITVKDSVLADVDYLKKHLREEDVKEIWMSHHQKSEEAVREAIERSLASLTVCNGKPILIFGINPVTLLGPRAVIWLLGTEDMKKIRIRFLKNCRSVIDYFLEQYPILTNYVSVENKLSIKWLKMLGAKFYKPAPYGKEGKMFIQFEFRRDDEI